MKSTFIYDLSFVTIFQIHEYLVVSFELQTCRAFQLITRPATQST